MIREVYTIQNNGNVSSEKIPWIYTPRDSSSLHPPSFSYFFTCYPSLLLFTFYSFLPSSSSIILHYISIFSLYRGTYIHTVSFSWILCLFNLQNQIQIVLSLILPNWNNFPHLFIPFLHYHAPVRGTFYALHWLRILPLVCKDRNIIDCCSILHI